MRHPLPDRRGGLPRHLITRRKFLQTTAGALAAVALTPVERLWAFADPFVRLDATAQAELVRRREVTPLELVDAAIKRIDTLNPRLNAIVTTCFDKAREQARGELPDGPFRGVPYAIKDLSDYAGIRTTLGSRLFESNVPSESNDIVQCALRAGLVVLGKTNTPELGLLPTTESLLLGAAHNPWNTERSTGGSSGGAAAAVASGMLPFAQASDGGGSIRIPASCCGVFGMKPSRGRILRRGPAPPGEISVRFTLSRSVRDSARFLSVCERRDAEAPLVPVGMVDGPSRRRLRIAFRTEDGTGGWPHPDVRTAIEETAALCADLGHIVEPAGYPIDGEEFMQHFLVLWASIPSQLSKYAWWIGLRQFRFVDAASVLEPWTLGLAEWLERKQDPNAIEKAVAYCGRVGRAYEEFFGKYDAQLTPVLREPPIRLGEQAPNVPFDTLLERVSAYASYTPPHNAAGTPAMSVPLSMSADGLPIGSQFAAAHGDERTLLELAYELEQARPWAHRWPSIAAV